MSFIANKLIRGSSIIGTEIDRLLFLTQPVVTVDNVQKFNSVAASYNGKYLLRSDYNVPPGLSGGIFVSQNYGKTWSGRLNYSTYNQLAVSGDGRVMYWTYDGSGSSSPVIGAFSSINYGNTFENVDNKWPEYARWGAITTNIDGSKAIYGETCNGVRLEIRATTNTGTTWNTLSNLLPNSTASTILSSCSSDGNTIIVNSCGVIYKTSNFGSSWIQIANFNANLAMSGDATKIILANTVIDYLKVSTNGGTSFNNITILGQRIWGRVAMSEDGTKMMARDQNNFVFLSTNSGSTWANYPI